MVLTKFEQAAKSAIEFFRDLRGIINNQGRDHALNLKTKRDIIEKKAETCTDDCVLELSQYFNAIAEAIEFVTTGLATNKLRYKLFQILMTQPVEILTTPYMKSMYEFLDLKFINSVINITVDSAMQGMVVMRFAGLIDDTVRELTPVTCEHGLNAFLLKQSSKPGSRLVIQQRVKHFLATRISPYVKQYGNPDSLLTAPAIFRFHTTNGRISNVGFEHIN